MHGLVHFFFTLVKPVMLDLNYLAINTLMSFPGVHNCNIHLNNVTKFAKMGLPYTHINKLTESITCD